MAHETFQTGHLHEELLECFHQMEENRKPKHIILHLNSESK